MNVESHLTKAEAKFDAPLSRFERARDHVLANQGMSANLGFRHISEFMGEQDPPAWLVKGWFELDSFGLVFGDPGVGKSFVAVDLACSIASGTPWHDHAVKVGSVLYLAGEGGKRIGRRFKAWALHHGVSLADARLYLRVVPASLTDAAGAAELLEIVERHAEQFGMPSLVVVDTVARNFGAGDENSTKDMSTFVKACDRIRLATGAFILLVHHSGHGDKKRARGSISLKGALDLEFVVTMESGVISLVCTKAKDSEPPEPKAFRLRDVETGSFDEDGDPVTSAVLVPALYMAPPTQGKAGKGKNQQVALRALQEGIAQCVRHHSEIGVTEDPWMGLTAWRAACIADGVSDKRFSEVSRNLAKQGFVSIEGERVTLQDREFAMPP